jgi:hypothetical protein
MTTVFALLRRHFDLSKRNIGLYEQPGVSKFSFPWAYIRLIGLSKVEHRSCTSLNSLEMFIRSPNDHMQHVAY